MNTEKDVNRLPSVLHAVLVIVSFSLAAWALLGVAAWAVLRLLGVL
jgi:hypothetical protein